MSEPTYYITTAIDYVNSKPHLGTAYEKIAADAIARYHRMLGEDVLFLMGNDEHSLKVEAAARERGLDPLAWCDQMEAQFKKAWGALDISYDDFIRTTQPRHVEAVRAIMERIHDAGDIYQREYEGWYCNGCESFKKENELEDGRCPLHPGDEATWLVETNWFFKLSKYSDFLLEHYADHPEFVRPEVRRNEMVEFIKQGLEDISISRESASWGIPVPFDDESVIYVWFDALVNYIAGAGWPNDQERFARFWPADLHVIGKDITRFHCIIWPAMLRSAGIELPRAVFGHGFVNLGRDRMSKSLGTLVDPIELADEYGADAIRHYLLAEAAFGRDLEFTYERLVTRCNADLANGIGNLLSRTVSMIVKYRDGVVPEASGESLVAAHVEEALTRYRTAMDSLDLRGGVEAALAIVARANALVDEEAPWSLAKQPESSARLDRVLYDLAESCRVAGVLLHPFMPVKMRSLRTALGTDVESAPRLEDAHFGGLRAGTRLEKGPGLFPRLEAPGGTA